MTPRHAEARRLAQRGIPVFPCHPGGKKAVYKDNGTRKWNETIDLAQIDAWWGAQDYNIGVRPIHFGLVAIDLDTYKPGGVSPEVLAMLPATRTHATPHGGEQRFYLTRDEFGNQVLARHVDVRSRNGYIMWPPSVVDGVEYKVLDNREPAPLPEPVAAQLRAKQQPDAEAVDCPDLGFDAMPAEARAYCAEIAADVREHPGRWKLAANLVRNFGLTDETATALCHEYDVRTEPGTDEGSQTPWAHELAHARQYGKGELGEGVAWQQPGSYDDTIPAEIDAYCLAHPEAVVKSPYVWLSLNDIITGHHPEPEWLIEGLVLREHINLLYGQSELGKSLLALAMGVAVNSGTELLGRKVSCKLPIVAAFCEDKAGAIQHHLRTGICETPLIGTPPFTVTCAGGADPTIATVRDDGTVDYGRFASELANQIKEVGESLVILDHVGILGCLNENFKTPVTVFIRRVLGSIIHKTNSTLVLLAHPTAAGLRYGDTGASGAWRASVRNTIIMTRPEGTDKDDTRRILEARGNYGTSRIECRLEYPCFNLSPETPAGGPSSLRLTVLNLLGASEVYEAVGGYCEPLKAAGFEASDKALAARKDLSDLFRRHGDGSLWHPLMFNPQQRPSD